MTKLLLRRLAYCTVLPTVAAMALCWIAGPHFAAVTLMITAGLFCAGVILREARIHPKGEE